MQHDTSIIFTELYIYGFRAFLDFKTDAASRPWPRRVSFSTLLKLYFAGFREGVNDIFSCLFI